MGSGSSSSKAEPTQPVPPNTTQVSQQPITKQSKDWTALVEGGSNSNRSPSPEDIHIVQKHEGSESHLPDPDVVLQPEHRQPSTMDARDRRLPVVASESTTLSLGTRPPKPSIHERIALEYESPRENPAQREKPKPWREKRTADKSLALVREETEIDEGEALQRLAAMLLKGSDKKQADFHIVLDDCKTETFRCQERLLLFTGDAEHELYTQLEASLRDVILRLNRLDAGHDQTAEDQRMTAIRHAQTVLDQLRMQALPR